MGDEYQMQVRISITDHSTEKAEWPSHHYSRRFLPQLHGYHDANALVKVALI